MLAARRPQAVAVKSGLRRLRNASRAPAGPPVPIATNYRRGLSFSLGAGRGSRETFMRQYGASGTVFSIVSLLQQSSASARWHLYKKQPQDGRRRYSSGDQGSDQRTEVVVHPALSLWNKPNDFMSGFEFREGSQQHQELTGETFWVLNREVVTFPTAMWYVRPDRMEPVPSPDDYLVGWIYTGPSGEQVPLKLTEVIQEKTPDPLDPFRGAGPVASILANIQQQKYATDYQRNLFINGADPGGVITFPGGTVKMTDREFDEFTDRWRESHQGIARAGAVAVLENGAVFNAAGMSNKDLEYGNLRLANRDEIREAWRMHKSMLGTVEDVNRANAQTAEEVFTGWQIDPRLERRRDTLNHKLLPMFGDATVEFDFEDPTPTNPEAASNEMVAKATAAQTLVNAGYDPADVLEVVGLPDMGVVEKATQEPALPPAWVPAAPGGAPVPGDGPAPRETVNILRSRPRALASSGQSGASWPGWQLDMQAVAYWAPLLAAAVTGALSGARAEQLAAAYLAAYPDGPSPGQGKREASAAAAAWLAAQGVTFVPAVSALTPGIITDAYLIGASSAAALAAGSAPDTGSWQPGDTREAERVIAALGLAAALTAALAAAALDAREISGRYLDAVAAELAAGAAAGLAAAAIAAAVADVLASGPRASSAVLNAVTVTCGGAAMGAYRDRDIAEGIWLTQEDKAVDGLCRANAEASPLPLGTQYPSGAVAPPAHVNCRCALIPAPAAPAADMAALLRRILSDGYVPVETGGRR